MARPSAAFDPRELALRIASAAVLLPIALGAIYLGSWPFGLLMALLCALMAREWVRISGAGGDRVLTVAAMLLTAASVLGAQAAEFALSLIVLGVGALVLGLVARRRVPAAAWAVGAGAIYIGITGDAAAWLRSHAADGTFVILWLVAVVVATDVGAYVAGRLIGGAKLAPAISPNKTWAGLLGGMAAAGLVSAFGFALPLGGAIGWSAFSGAVLAAVAQGGDLLESWMKRRAGVKDSGRGIPGHGGFLDRFDGFLAATPAMAALILVFGTAPIR